MTLNDVFTVITIILGVMGAWGVFSNKIQALKIIVAVVAIPLMIVALWQSIQLRKYEETRKGLDRQHTELKGHLKDTSFQVREKQRALDLLNLQLITSRQSVIEVAGQVFVCSRGIRELERSLDGYMFAIDTFDSTVLIRFQDSGFYDSKLLWSMQGFVSELRDTYGELKKWVTVLRENLDNILKLITAYQNSATKVIVDEARRELQLDQSGNNSAP